MAKYVDGRLVALAVVSEEDLELLKDVCGEVITIGSYTYVAIKTFRELDIALQDELFNKY